MLDFPANPTVGQQFTSGGATWVWDGAKWTSVGASAAFLPLAGGTITGDLIINAPNNQGLTINGPSGAWNGIELNAKSAGQGNWIGGYVNNKERWEIDIGNAIAETGSNSGSDFQITRFNDAGTQIDNPLVITRTDGVVYANKGLSAQQAIGDNRIINGDMRIDQRNNGASVANTAGNVFSVDRWIANGSAANVFNVGRNLNAIGGPPGFMYYIGVQSLSAFAIAAGSYFALQQRIEAEFIGDLGQGTANAQSFTISFWVYSSLTGTFSGAVDNVNAGTNRNYLFTYSISAANTWTKIVVTIPGDTTGGGWTLTGNLAGLRLLLDLGSGANFRGAAGVWGPAASYPMNGVTGSVSVVATNAATFYVTGVKLEIGSVATPFNRQSLAKSIEDCQRYYQVLGGGQVVCTGYSGAGSAFYTCLPMPVQMRAAPSGVVSGASYSNASNLALSTTTANMIVTSATMTATGLGWAGGTLALNAEL